MKKTRGENIFAYFNAVLMLLIAIISVYPIYYVLMGSFSDPVALMKHDGLLFLPAGFSLSAYSAVLDKPMILQGYRNTLIILVMGLALSIFLTSLGAYFLSQKGPLWRKPVLFFIITTMYINGGLVPTYLNLKALGMYNNYFALTVPFAINIFNLLIMRTAFEAVPLSLEESATIDGANEFFVLFRIIIPLSLPTIAVLLLYYGVAIWNSWFFGMILIQDRNLLPLQVILREILIQNETAALSGDAGGAINIAETVKYATIIISTVPILCAYPFLQRYFVSGIMIGAVKG
ncbi:MAG: carbohydrate ABC transporter permease [Firmicutes bacterium]|nr:carbohydrate ABC transporter permease [Bacillota bacterium]